MKTQSRGQVRRVEAKKPKSRIVSLRMDERAIILIAFGVTHTTQFLINVPVARRGGRIGESYWDVLRGPMLFIFVVDAAMATLYLAVAAAMWL